MRDGKYHLLPPLNIVKLEIDKQIDFVIIKITSPHHLFNEGISKVEEHASQEIANGICKMKGRDIMFPKPVRYRYNADLLQLSGELHNVAKQEHFGSPPDPYTTKILQILVLTTKYKEAAYGLLLTIPYKMDRTISEEQ